MEESRLEEREIPAHFFRPRGNRGFSLLSSSPFLALTPGVNKCNRIGLSLSLPSFFLHPRRNWIAAKPPSPSPLAKKMRKRKRMEKFRLNRVLLLLLFPTCREKHTCLSPSLCLHIFSASNFHVSMYVLRGRCVCGLLLFLLFHIQHFFPFPSFLSGRTGLQQFFPLFSLAIFLGTGHPKSPHYSPLFFSSSPSPPSFLSLSHLRREKEVGGGRVGLLFPPFFLFLYFPLPYPLLPSSSLAQTFLSTEKGSWERERGEARSQPKNFSATGKSEGEERRRNSSKIFLPFSSPFPSAAAREDFLLLGLTVEVAANRR